MNAQYFPNPHYSYYQSMFALDYSTTSLMSFPASNVHSPPEVYLPPIHGPNSASNICFSTLPPTCLAQLSLFLNMHT